MTIRYTDEDIKWIKQYRKDNDCGLQVAKRVLLRSRIRDRINNQNLASDTVLRELFNELLELMR